jgi:hypothetical protein
MPPGKDGKPASSETNSLMLLLDCIAAAAESEGSAAINSLLADAENVAFWPMRSQRKIHELMLNPSTTTAKLTQS